jgi:hypothetical protein
MRNQEAVVPLYLAMLAAHIGHVFEEVWGRFWLIEAFHGLGLYLAANGILFCIPLIVFFFLLRGNRTAAYLAAAYSAVMVLNGIGHNLATIATGRYFDGFAGGFSGIGLTLIGVPLIYALGKGIRRKPA